MADTIVPFVVIAGLATGITATTVITEAGSVPVAVTSFNGATGAITGVGSFNGSTGAVTGVTSTVAGTGISISGTTRPTITNTGVNSIEGMTGDVLLPGHSLYLYSIGII